MIGQECPYDDTVGEWCFHCEDENNIFEKGNSDHFIEFKNGEELEFCSHECKTCWKEQFLEDEEEIQYQSEDK